MLAEEVNALVVLLDAPVGQVVAVAAAEIVSSGRKVKFSHAAIALEPVHKQRARKPPPLTTEVRSGRLKAKIPEVAFRLMAISEHSTRERLLRLSNSDSSLVRNDGG